MLTRVLISIAVAQMIALTMAWAQPSTQLKEPAPQGQELKEPAPQGQELKEPTPQGQELKESVPQNENAPPNASSPQSAAPSVASLGANVAGGVTCTGQGPCMVEATEQPLRILPRALAPLFKQPDDTVAPASDAVAPFKPAYVFQRQGLDFSQPTAPQGWYQVGYTTRAPLGWMRARDVLEWRQAILLAYTHPGKGEERRHPVLMFERKEPLQKIVTAGDRKARAEHVYATLGDGRKPEQVIGKESNRFLNIDETFYLLPVLQWEREEAFDEFSHYLQVFAAAPGERAAKPGEGTLQDPKALRQQANPEAAPLGRLDVDIKFVVDMTGSMQPSISQVAAALKRIASDLVAVDPNQASVRFGLVGYRDDVSKTPSLAWTTRNFTPELIDGPRFRDLLINGGQDLVAKVSSDEWAEDVFAGYKLGLESPWTSPTSLKLMFLIGDASGHPPSTSQLQTKNTVNLGAEQLRGMADQKGVYVTSIYLKDERAAVDWPRAIEQFSALGRNQEGQSGFFPLQARNQADLDAVAQQFIDDVNTRIIKRARAGDATGIEKFAEEGAPEPQALPPAAGADAAQGIAVARGVIRAALVDYLGDAEQAPKDFISWVHDYDLGDPLRQALGVRVLMTRQEFDTIIRQTTTLADAVTNARLARMDFFQSLQVVSAKTSLGMALEAGKSLAEQQFLPKWVSALPYQSRVLGMAPSTFENLTQQEQITFDQTLQSKLQAYKDIYNAPDRWIKIDPNDAELDEVIALPLSFLP